LKYSKRMKSKIIKFSIKLVTAILITPSLITQATVSLPAVNLGDSNFQDAIAGPGFLFQETLISYSSDKILDATGNELPGNRKVDNFVAQSHFAYFSQKKLFGGFIGAEALLPYVKVQLNSDFAPQASTTDFGDLKISPLMLQFNDSKLFGMQFWQRLNFSFSIPTGNYATDKVPNIGNNFYTFNPHYAFTVAVNKSLEVSGRIHYLYNGENDKPAQSLQAKTVQAGQAMHMNFASSYAFNRNWRVGIAGYYLKQLSDDKIDSISIPNSKEELIGIGPGIKFSGKGQFFYMNYFKEVHAENRAKGQKFSIRYSVIW